MASYVEGPVWKVVADEIGKIAKDLTEAKAALHTFLYWIEEWMEYYGVAEDMLTDEQRKALAIAQKLVGD